MCPKCQRKKNFLTVQVLTRAKSKLLSQRALKLWRQSLAIPVSDIVGLWGLSGRRKLSQLPLSSLITAPPGTASLLSSSPSSHPAQHGPGQFGFATQGFGCWPFPFVSIYFLKILHFSWQTFILSVGPKEGRLGRVRGGFALTPLSCERHCLFHIRKTASGPLLWEIPILPEAGKYFLFWLPLSWGLGLCFWSPGGWDSYAMWLLDPWSFAGCFTGDDVSNRLYYKQKEI